MFAIYVASLIGAVAAAFLLRELSIGQVAHLTLPDRKIVAVSFISSSERQLQETVESAQGNEEIRDLIKGQRDWVLIQVMERNGPVVHVMIDAGMTRSNAKNLPLSKEGINLVFSRRKDSSQDKGPFSAWARWQPVLVAETKDANAPHVLDIDQRLFLGNPVMPVF